MKIAIYGDSFGLAPSPQRKDPWYQQLAQMLNAEATSFAQPGSSNFYNYKNFLKHNKDFDLNIFIHTSSLKYPVSVNLTNVRGKQFEQWPSSLAATEYYRDQWEEGPMDDLTTEFLNHLHSWYIVSDDAFMSLSVELMMNDMEMRRPNTIFLASFSYDPSWEMNPDYDIGRNRKEKLSISFPQFMRVQAKSLGILQEGSKWHQENLEFISCHMTPETNAVFGKSVYDLITTGKMTPPPAHIPHNYGPEHYFIQTK